MSLAPAGSPAWAAAAAPVPLSAVDIVVSADDLGAISPALFGSNLMWPYNAEGAFNPATNSFYLSFVKAVQQTGMTSLRYPAGISADSFDWERAIGPADIRQANEPYGMQAGSLTNGCCTVDGPAPSTVGPDEYGQLLDQTGTIGNVVVNSVTGTAQEAADFVAYMTAPEGTFPSSDPSQPSYWAALRSADGHPAPYNVPYWEVGNEQDARSQYGWRSGGLVSIGPHTTDCLSTQIAACLYAFGGTTAFSDQSVGTFADEQQPASYSTGSPDQDFYIYFPPVVPNSESIYVAGQKWTAVPSLSTAGPDDEVFSLDASTGEIYFGDGVNGAVPPPGAKITASYQSGPHDGFVEFYRAMKQMNPAVQVCESEEANVNFLKVMGLSYPYDCVGYHPYASPSDTSAPLPQYEEDLLGNPASEGAGLAVLQQEVLQYSGKDIPVVLTEYGQLVGPEPQSDPNFNLSLDEGLLAGAQLEQWAASGVPLAEKYLLNSTPFLSNSGDQPLPLGIELQGLSVNNSMIAGPYPNFVLEPTAEVMDVMSRLGGAERLGSSVLGNPDMAPYPNDDVPTLQVLAASSDGNLDLVVINASPLNSVTTVVNVGAVSHDDDATVTLVDGATPTSYNTVLQPAAVSTTVTTTLFTTNDFPWTFPAHSLTFLQFGGSSFSEGAP